MRKVIFYCDKCGIEIQGDPAIVGTGDIYDLCPKCAAELNSIVSNWISGKTTERKTQGRKKDIDMPKVHALKNAGWSLEKIGIEFGVAPQTIANHLKAEQEALNGED